MATNDLPTEFDIIVLGTGLTETIAAAAFSRIGLKVLHLDRNDYYGGSFANFNLEGIEKWAKHNQDLETAPLRNCTHGVSEELSKKIGEGETFVGLPNAKETACHIKSQFHVRKRTAEENEKHTAKKRAAKPIWIPPPIPDQETNYGEKKNEEAKEEMENPSGNDEESICAKVDDDTKEEKNCGADTAEKEPKEEEAVVQGEDSKPQGSELTDSRIQSVPEDSSTVSDCSIPDLSKTDTTMESQPSSEEAKEPEVKEWTEEDVRDEWRRYCFDISPRVVHCSGEFVELLIQSDVARYCEFRTVSRVLTMLKDALQQVPCSRADVFSSKMVSLIEKRLMMKYLQFASDYESSPKEYEEYIGKPFTEFLKSQKLTANVRHFVQHAIAMVTDLATTEEGLQKTQKFLRSLGRYGNTAFLFSLYGSGELPQAFSRLSAVFGGIYCLLMSAKLAVGDAENKCCGIVTSENQKISCKYLVADSSYLPMSWVRIKSESETSRAIFVTDKSICPSQSEELSLLNYPCQDDLSRPVTVLELPYSSCVCPKGVSVVHMTRVNNSNHVEEDFQEIRDKLFGDGTGDKPQILWSIYFHQFDKSQVELTEAALKNVLVTSGGGDVSVDMESYVEEAKQIFKTICPDEEFLPTPPDPEDIIHVDDTEAAVASGPAEFSQESSSEENKGGDETKCETEGRAGEKDGADEEKVQGEKNDSEASVLENTAVEKSEAEAGAKLGEE